MCWQKSCKALAATPVCNLPAGKLSGERAQGVPGLPARSRDLPVSKLPESEGGTAFADAGDCQARVRYGYRKIRVLLNREGWNVSRYLAYRLYQEEGLALRPRRSRRRRAAVPRRERFRSTAPNQVWGLDFIADQLVDGRRFRALTVVDIYTRESLAIEAGQSLKGEDVVMVLNRIMLQRGAPKMLFCDNGSEFASQAMDLWAYRNGVRIDFSATREANRQCLRRVVQWNLAGGMPRRSLVHNPSRGQATYRTVAQGIQ
jgi:transposase InsO family protein